jgi:hypothetical protein
MFYHEKPCSNTKVPMDTEVMPFAIKLLTNAFMRNDTQCLGVG